MDGALSKGQKNNFKEAEEELEFIANRDKELKQENIAKVAYEVLAGELAAAKGDLPKAIEHLEQAVSFVVLKPENRLFYRVISCCFLLVFSAVF